MSIDQRGGLRAVPFLFETVGGFPGQIPQKPPWSEGEPAQLWPDREEERLDAVWKFSVFYTNRRPENCKIQKIKRNFILMLTDFYFNCTIILNQFRMKRKRGREAVKRFDCFARSLNTAQAGTGIGIPQPARTTGGKQRHSFMGLPMGFCRFLFLGDFSCFVTDDRSSKKEAGIEHWKKGKETHFKRRKL